MRFKDGTPYTPPKNPLYEKYPECEQGIGYRCMFCRDCPHGDHWVLPEEDKDVWDQHCKDVKAYVDEHGGLGELLLEPNVDYQLLDKMESNNENSNL